MLSSLASLSWLRQMRAATAATHHDSIMQHDTDDAQGRHGGSRSPSPWAVAPVLVLLALLVAHGTAEKLHARLLQYGQQHWPGYATLRHDPIIPACNPETASAPAAAPANDSDALLDAVMGEGAQNAPSEGAALAAKQDCIQQHAAYTDIQNRLTQPLRTFRAVETSLAAFVDWSLAWMRHTLVALLLICAGVATRQQAHIAMRPPKTANEERLVGLLQLAALSVLAGSWWAVMAGQNRAPLAGQDVIMPWLWLAGLGFAASGTVTQMFAPKQHGSAKLPSPACIPLYVVMVLVGGAYFFVFEKHPAGLAIYLQQLTEHALLYAHVGLYVWVGMLLKQTLLAERCFAILRPWRLPPELLAFVVVTAAAIPTAYSGASGIFVIAAGAMIYQELRRAGANDQMALAATAMSGSLGVVLSPCLLVVIAASLNKQVTTQALYRGGLWVFALTAGLYLVACLWLGRGRIRPAPQPDAAVASARAWVALVPTLAIGGIIILLYKVLLNTRVDEHTAPTILPVILFGIILYEVWERRAPAAMNAAAQPPAARLRGPNRAVWQATAHAASHIGALLLLMGASVCVGGMIQRAEILSLVPHAFASPTLAMAALVAMLVVIGMCMDPYGAVILVSASIAEVAYSNGIAPVHFWLVVLVAFELGYLMPPIALNQLLARRVVGSVHVPHDGPAPQTWFGRHLGLVLPVSVMASALLLVAFGPLVLGITF